MNSRRANLFLSLFLIAATFSACATSGGGPTHPPSSDSGPTPDIPPISQNVTIEGKVYISGSQSPISGAIVTTSLDNQIARTDANGYFLLKTNTVGQGNYAKKPYGIKVSAEGFLSFSQVHNWGDNPANQTFSLTVYDPYAHIKEIAAPIVENEYKNYLTASPMPADTTGGQPKREQELQKAFNQENTVCRESQSEENVKFTEEREKDLELLEKSVKKAEESQEPKMRREFSGKWEQKRNAKQKKHETEKFYLKGRQILERKQMKTMFVQEREKMENPDTDQSDQQKDAWEDYIRKHGLPAYLIALGQGQDIGFPAGHVRIKIEPETIERGKSAKLLWEAWNTDKEVMIEPGIGRVVGQKLKKKLDTGAKSEKDFTLPSVGYGSTINVSPDKNTTYKITSKDWNGKDVDATEEVKVTEPAAPPPVDEFDGTYTGTWNLTCPTCGGSGDTASGTFTATVLNGVFTGKTTLTVGSHSIPVSPGTVSSSGVITATHRCSDGSGVSTLTGQIAITSLGGAVMTVTYSRPASPGNCGAAESGTLTATRGGSVDEVRHEMPQVRRFEIRAVCDPGSASYLSKTRWNPPTIEVNEGDHIEGYIYGPDAKAAESCFSVSFAIPEYNVYVPKVERGRSHSFRFHAGKAGKFAFVDSERHQAQTGPIKLAVVRDETIPGSLIVHKNVPPGPKITRISRNEWGENYVILPTIPITDGKNIFVFHQWNWGITPYSFPIEGGPPKKIYEHLGPHTATCHGKYIYTVNNFGKSFIIYEAPADGSGPISVIFSKKDEEAITPGSIISPWGITSDGDKIYIADRYQGRVHSLTMDKVGRVQTAQIGVERYEGGRKSDRASSIVAYKDNLYILDAAKDSEKGKIVSIPKSGGTFSPVYEGPHFKDNWGYMLTAGKDMLYVSDQSANTVWTLPVGGGRPTVLFSEKFFRKVYGAVFSGDALYVAASEYCDPAGQNYGTGGGIFKVELP